MEKPIFRRKIYDEILEWKENSRCKISILQNEGVIGSFSYAINGGKRYCREKSLTKHVARGTSARLNPTVSLRRRKRAEKRKFRFFIWVKQIQGWKR
ncbi:MAG: hypothetical protein J5717_05905 [Lachnospiraceae bacterium]|nr:hypothetical protein [Lachnospiraceae bacterium]